jgi:hypothetical protein
MVPPELPSRSHPVDAEAALPARAALPFVLTRTDKVYGEEFRVTEETLQGLLVLQGDQLQLQWRREQQTNRYGTEVRSDRAIDPVRATAVPLSALSSARLEERWWRRSAWLVIMAADLAAFDGVAGADGLQLDHPGELRVPVARAAREQARSFVNELEYALAELAMQRAEADEPRLPRSRREAPPGPEAVRTIAVPDALPEVTR